MKLAALYSTTTFRGRVPVIALPAAETRLPVTKPPLEFVVNDTVTSLLVPLEEDEPATPAAVKNELPRMVNAIELLTGYPDPA
jgi:hypothetical protein